MASSVSQSESGKASWFGRMLSSAGINGRQFLALIYAYLLMDFRNQQFGSATATGPKSRISPLFFVLGQNLVIGFAASFVLFGRVDAGFFAMAGLACSMIIMATALIVEFNEVVVAPDDLEVIGHQPVPLRTYSSARVTNLLGYVLLVTFSLNLFPAIVGVGLRDSSWLFFPAYVLSALVANLAVSAVVIMLYAFVMSGRPNDLVQELLAWAQIAMMAVLFYGGQLVLRKGTEDIQMLAYDGPTWLAFMPPTWFGNFIASTGPTSSSVLWWVPVAGVAFCGVAWTAVIWRLSVVYARMQPGGSAWSHADLPPLARPGELSGRLGRWLTRSSEERTAYWLCATMLKRDHNLRMRCWPSLGLVVVIVGMGWFLDRLDNPYEQVTTKCVLSLAAVYLLAAPIPTIFYNLRFCRDYQASWVLVSAPIDPYWSFVEGIRKAVTYRILLPTVIILFFVFLAAWNNVWHALIHVGLGWLVVLSTGYACQMVVLRKLPFSAPLSRGAAFGPIALFAGVVTGVAMFFAGLHYVAQMQKNFAFPIYVAVTIVVTVVLRFRAKAVLTGFRPSGEMM